MIARLGGALLLALFSITAASAATQQVSPASGWVLLGAGPLQVQVTSGNACIVAASSPPTDVSGATCDFNLFANQISGPTPLNTNQNIYAFARNAPALVAFTAISAGSNGGSGSGPVTGTGGTQGMSVGTSSMQIIPAPANGTVRKSLIVFNQSATATVTVCSASATYNSNAVTPSANAPGCYTLNPNGGSLAYPASGYVPQDAFNAVASAANTPVTIEVH